MRKIKLTLSLCLAASLSFAQFNNVVNIAGTGLLSSNSTPDPGLGESQPNYLGSATPPNGQAFTAIKNNIGGPTGITTDNNGNVFYIDKANSCVMKVNKFGVVSLVAGVPNTPYPTINPYNYSAGTTFAGAAHLPASAPYPAQFYAPNSICFDKISNNLYISDAGNQNGSNSGNGVVWMIQNNGGQITSSCKIYLVAGDPTGASSVADNVPANQCDLIRPGKLDVDKNGALYISEAGNGVAQNAAIRVIHVPVYNTVNYTPNTIQTLFSVPDMLYTHSIDPNNGDLYYVAKDVANGTTIYRAQNSSGVPGTTSVVFIKSGLNYSNVLDIAVDASHNVYIADQSNFVIKEASGTASPLPTTASIIAGNGNISTAFNFAAPAGNSNIKGVSINPYGLAVDGCGSVYFADIQNYVIGKLANPVTYTPSISVVSPICSASGGISVTGVTGVTGSNIAPDSYSWSILSCNAAGHPDGIYQLQQPIVVNNTTAQVNSNTNTIPITSAMPCDHNYIIQCTVSKACPVLSVETATAQVYINCSPAASIAGTTNLCSSSTNSVTTLCASPSGSPYTFSWYTGLLRRLYISNQPCITESPAGSTFYGVVVTNTTTGCASDVNVPVNVYQNNPSFSLIENSINGTPNLNASYGTFEAAVTSNLSTTSAPGFVQELSSTGAVNWTTQSGTAANISAWQSLTANTFCGIDNYVTDYGTGGITVPNSTLSGACSGSYGMFKPNTSYAITLTSWNNYCPAKPYTYPATNLTGGREMQTASINNSLIDGSKQLLIYPNPSSGSFTIETEETTPQVVEVFDITGRVILSQTIIGNTVINAGNLPDGMYNVKVSGNNTIVNKKVIISK